LDALQFVVCSSVEHAYILLNSWNSKTFNVGFEHRRLCPRSIKQFDSDSEKCVYKIVSLYLSMILKNGPFYRKPLLSALGFGKQCVGTIRCLRI